MIFHILFNLMNYKMNELCIRDRVYLFEKFKEIEAFFQDKFSFSLNFKNRKRKFLFKLFDEKGDKYTSIVMQILRVYIDDQATDMYIKVLYGFIKDKPFRRVRLVSLDIKQRIMLEKEYKEIEV